MNKIGLDVQSPDWLKILFIVTRLDPHNFQKMYLFVELINFAYLNTLGNINTINIIDGYFIRSVDYNLQFRQLFK